MARASKSIGPEDVRRNNGILDSSVLDTQPSNLPTAVGTPVEYAACLNFGPFSLRNHGEALYRHEERVRLGSRARQILALLAARAGHVVSKADLIASVWPDTTVLENNLTVHIAALRHALGDGRDGLQYIVNVPGRGYRFVASVREGWNQEEAPGPPAKEATPTNLPVRLTPTVGLSRPLEEVAAKLRDNNLVTVTGPAGVGKTTLALHAAQARLLHHPDGVWLVDLAPLRNAEHLPAAVATTLRIDLGAADPAHSMQQALGRSNALLILDNCEHLIDAVATLAAMILRHCPQVVLLATSREPLRVSGEMIYGLAPLDTPPNCGDICAREALTYPAVQLLVERVSAASNEYALTDEDAVAAAVVCRRLDGLPLAIEFAAGLVRAFGLTGLVDRLDYRFVLMQSDMRGVSDRHRTLTTALDWSYGLLEVAEQVALQRLAVFAGGFTLEGAAAIVGMGDLGELGGLLARLHTKSLITADIARKDLRFRLLETTRAYALDKLEEAGATHEIRLRHAAYFSDMLRKQRLRLGEREIAEDAIELDDIRMALRFTMGPSGDTNIALSLASAALPVWLGLSLIPECIALLREVWALLTPDQTTTAEGWDLAITMRVAEMFTTGVTPEAYQNWAVPSESAPKEPHTRRPLVEDALTRWMWRLRRCHAPEIRNGVKAHFRLVRDSVELHDQITASWVAGLSSFELGELAQAKTHLQHFLEIETPRNRRIFSGRSGFDRTPGAQGRLGTVLCLMGETGQGLRAARTAEGIGLAAGKALPICEAKQWTHVSYEIAQLDTADLEAGLDEYVEMARNHLLDGHLGAGLGLKGLRVARQGQYGRAEELLRQSVDLLLKSGTEEMAPWFLGTLGYAIGRQGRVEEAMKIIEDWRLRDLNPNGWCAAELRRSIGNLHFLNGDMDRAEITLTEARAMAYTQGAVAWVMRTDRDLESFSAPLTTGASSGVKP